jgi:hypothetical protein
MKKAASHREDGNELPLKLSKEQTVAPIRP